jgi:hypothetical protein
MIQLHFLIAKKDECDQVLSMLSEIDEGGDYSDLAEALFHLEWRDIPFEICSEVKQSERLEELEQILIEAKASLSELLIEPSAYEYWLSYYPDLKIYLKRSN